MKLQVKLFAAAQQAVGQPMVEIELGRAATVADLRQQLVANFPALETLQSHLLVAVDQQYAPDDLSLKQGDEVACFPPVSGG